MKTKLLKKLRTQAFENFNFTCGKWSKIWITKIDNIYFQTSIFNSDMLYTYHDNDKIFLRECIVRTVKVRRGEKIEIVVNLYDLLRKSKV